MPEDWIVYACLGAGLSSALVAGVFQSFSDFVMRSLIAARPAGGIEAMQMINRKVFRSIFLTMFLVMVPASLVLAIYAQVNLAGPAPTWIITGASIYLIGVFLVTMLGNVPMNQRLNTMDPLTEKTVDYWKTYGRVWTRWNHVRTLGSLAASVCFLIASIALA